MNIVVLGGDGFCGWPTALKLSKSGHKVTIIDNLCRRSIDVELSSNSLTNIASIADRLSAARLHGMDIDFYNIDIAKEYYRFVVLLENIRPDAVVHFAEQRAAPYSMISEKERRYTVDNNIPCTHNVLNAIVEVDTNIHLVHLGTMGVYGYSAAFGKIPEGYLDITINQTNEKVDILYPTNPGSVYHMTKSLDQILFQFYNKNWGLKITDLHQGIVWGTQTDETVLDDKLVNRFDYDGIYGTVLNRFISQAAAGIPITVYGTGEQTRAFIHIKDTVQCVKLSIENPPEDTSRVRIFNQVAETKRLIDLANMLAEKYNSQIEHVKNPRKEAASNDLEVANNGLRGLGLSPITLDEALVEDVMFIAKQLSANLRPEQILNSPEW